MALGANGYAAIEAIRSDMGWSTFSERCMKGSLMYKKKIERMEETMWVTKVCENIDQMSKWSGMCKCIVKKCDLKVRVVGLARRQNGWNIETMENEGNEWDISGWKKVIREKVEEFGLKKWKQGISGKSTLKWYE